MNTAINEILNSFNISLIIRFGNREISANDLDLLIVSDDFIGISNYKRAEIIKFINPLVDPICFTRLEFEIFQNKNNTLYRKIKSDSTILYGNHTFTN